MKTGTLDWAGGGGGGAYTELIMGQSAIFKMADRSTITLYAGGGGGGGGSSAIYEFCRGFPITPSSLVHLAGEGQLH